MAKGNAVLSHLAARWLAVAGVAAIAIGVGVIVFSAYGHTAPAGSPGEAAPVPTFTLGVATPTATPTPTPVPSVLRDTERFLAVGTGVGSSVWWRGIAGACGNGAPTVERSTDGGLSWSDVTPLYMGATQLAALDSVDQTEAELIVGVGSTCEPQAFRTYTQGQFWDSYPTVLAASRFVALTDAAALQLSTRSTPAPCADARGLRARGDFVALVCDGTALVSVANASWLALPSLHAVAVAIDGDDILVAHAAESCSGLTLTRYEVTDRAQPQSSSCAGGLDSAQRTAIAPTNTGTLVWSGESLVVVP